MPTPTPLPPTLSINPVPATNSAHGGDTVKFTITVSAGNLTNYPSVDRVQLALTAVKSADVTVTPSCVLTKPDEHCVVGDLTGKYPEQKVNVTAKIRNDMTSGKVVLTAEATGKYDTPAGPDTGDISSGPVTATIYITAKPKPSPSPSTSKSSNTTSSTTASSNTNKNSSGSNTTSSGSSTTGNPSGSVTSNPQGTSSPVQSPNVAAPLPTITPGAAPPSVAPDGSAAEAAGSTTALRSGSSQQDLTFERLASTQVAWLAALLVAFSVLLTQVRLGRRPNAVAARPKAAHRRTRKGVFEA